jgi:hypothetical protein
MAVAFAAADVAETGCAVKGQAGGVFRHHLGLQGPVAFGFRNGDQAVQQARADTLPVGVFADIDADLSDTRGASGIRHGRKRRPAEDFLIAPAGDQAADIEMSGIPRIPPGRVRHEGGEAGREPFGVQIAHLFPVRALHVLDGRDCRHG